MGLFHTKSPEAKAAALAEQMIRSRYIRARGDLYDAVFEAGHNGGADPSWVGSVMPCLAREAAEAWLDVYPNPSEADLNDLWEKDLRTFWNRSYWDDFDTATKDLAQEISVAVQHEVVREHAIRSGSNVVTKPDAGATGTLHGENASGFSDAANDISGSSSQEPAESPDAKLETVGVARAIEVWRWANAEKLSDSARSRLDRVARLVTDNAIGSAEVTTVAPSEQIRFEQTRADMKHGREMIHHVTKWITDDPSGFETSLGLYLDGGGANDGLDIETAT